MSEADLLTLCVMEEAAGEPQDGRAAVAKVILNRTARHYQSDGTIRSTILWPNAFSWTSWDMVGGKYQKVAHSPGEVEARVQQRMERARKQATTWAACEDVAQDVQAGTYEGGAEFQKLGSDAVLYLNPKIVAKLPAWADPAKLICTIGHHSFYRA